jgi:hypothetical protein
VGRAAGAADLAGAGAGRAGAGALGFVPATAIPAPQLIVAAIRITGKMAVRIELREPLFEISLDIRMAHSFKVDRTATETGLYVVTDIQGVIQLAGAECLEPSYCCT